MLNNILSGNHKPNNKIVNAIAVFLLGLMLTLAFFSMRDDSSTMDELPHIPSGYSYITQRDMRLNPEHPPLLKDLAGLSVWLGSKMTNTTINFPTEVESWQKEVNGQWTFGRIFLYQSDNDADRIIFWGRLPMLLIMLTLGWYVFKWAKELYGSKGGLIALFLYSFSPTFIAHGRYVTTDVGAAAAFFIAIYYLVKWLKEPTKRNLVLAGITFGIAMLTKFSLVLLIPYFIFLAIVWGILQKRFLKNIFALILIGLIGMALVYPVYLFHIWDYPQERQLSDTQYHFRDFAFQKISDPIIWMADKPILRPYGQFFLGLLMVVRRATGGNTTYFLGEVSNQGWHHYFPIVFLIKVPLVLLILASISLGLLAFQIKKPFWRKPYQRSKTWIKDHFAEFALISFFILYWASSIQSNLNIGVRHVLPTFPVLYLLISGQLTKWLNTSFKSILEKILSLKDASKSIRSVIFLGLRIYFKHLIVIALLIWYVFGVVKIYPHFLAYFNELAGGPENGHRYVTDSNLDWGQDLKRLTSFVEENNIDKIHVDYFGGGWPEYYLGDKFEPWWDRRNPDEFPDQGWLAISATFLQGTRGTPAPGFAHQPGRYNWVEQYDLSTVVGHSIFVYNIRK